MGHLYPFLGQGENARFSLILWENKPMKVGNRSMDAAGRSWKVLVGQWLISGLRPSRHARTFYAGRLLK
jgi:hypothetical protein